MAARLSEHHELRLTQRCLVEDFGCESEHPFFDLAGQPLIDAFVDRRRDEPEDGRVIFPVAGERPVCRLDHADGYCGATWHDEECAVVWLLAYTRHPIGDQAHAVAVFRQLRAEGRLMPTTDDYEDLLDARDLRFKAVVGKDASELLARARETPGKEHRSVIGRQVAVSVEILDAGEAFFAVEASDLNDENWPVLVAALFPEHDYRDVTEVGALPHRELAYGELGFRIRSTNHSRFQTSR